MKTEIVCFGEVLWDILPDKELPGGAPMNVAYHLQKMGHTTAMVTRIGTDAYGEQLLELMRGYGLNTAYVQRDEQAPTGKVLATITPAQEMAYDILFPAAWDFIAADLTWEAFLDAHPAYIIFGSLSSRHLVSREALKAMLRIPALRVLDVNLRPPHFTREHVDWLLQHADIVKINEHELAELSDWFGFSGDMEARIEQLQEKYLPRAIIVTLGAAGAVLYEDGGFHYEKGHRVTVVDTIGSGDALLAGYLHARHEGRGPAAAIRFGNALGALVAGKAGGCPPYEKEEIDALMKTV